MPIFRFTVLLFLASLFISCERKENDNFLNQEPVYIPDIEFFRDLIWNGADTNGDGVITYGEAATIKFLNLSSYFGPEISDLTGIEAFRNLTTLVCRCNRIVNMDLSKNRSLREVYAYDNDLRSIDVSGCTELEYLHIGSDGLCLKNRLCSLDISNNEHLRTLICNNNLIEELDVSKNLELEILECQLNQLRTLNLSNNTKLNVAELWGNQLSCLDVSNCTSLTVLDFSLNQVLETNLRYNRKLVELDVSRTPLSVLDLSRNTSLRVLIIKDMPNLDSICVWTSPFPPPELKVFSGDNSNILFSSTCL